MSDLLTRPDAATELLVAGCGDDLIAAVTGQSPAMVLHDTQKDRQHPRPIEAQQKRPDQKQNAQPLPGTALRGLGTNSQVIENALEASTGIEPVYTDLQSTALPNENSALTPKKYQDKTGTGGEPDTGVKPRRKNLGRRIKPPHKSMARMMGFCLADGTSEAWAAFCAVAVKRLEPAERAALAWAALRSLPPEVAEEIANTVLAPLDEHQGAA